MVHLKLENFQIKNLKIKNSSFDFSLNFNKNYFLSSVIIFKKFLFHLNLEFFDNYQYINWNRKNAFQKKFNKFKRQEKISSKVSFFNLGINSFFKDKSRPLLKYAKFTDLILYNEFKTRTSTDEVKLLK